MNKKYLCVIVCMLVIISALPIAGAVYWWPKFHHDVENTGYSPSSAPNQGYIEWSFEAGDSILCAPAVQDGKIYFGTDDFYIYCFDSDPSDGEDEGIDDPDEVSYDLIWSYYTGENNWVVSSPAIAYGMVYIGADDGYFYCFDADPSDGEDEGIDDPNGVSYDLIWKFLNPSGEPVELASPSVADGKVYIGLTGSDDKSGTIYCFDADPSDSVDDGIQDGVHELGYDIIWYFTTGGPIWCSPALANGRVYVGQWMGDKNFYCLDADPFEPNDPDDGIHDNNPASGYDLIWDYQLGYFGISSPVIVEKDGQDYPDIYIETTGFDRWYQMGRIYCLEDLGNEASKKWEYKPRGPIINCGNWLDSSLAVSEGKVYFSAVATNYLVKWIWTVGCLNADNGEEEWYKKLSEGWFVPTLSFDQPTSSPAVADGKVYVGHSGDGYFYCFDTSDGNELWKLQTDNTYFHSSPAVADGKVYVGDLDGMIYCLGYPDTTPPNPPTVTGPTDGKIGKEYTYTVSATDDDGDQVRYWIEWGDGTHDGWSDLYNSGEEVEFSHTWLEKDTFNIKARAMDENGAISYWGYLEVTMPFEAVIDKNLDVVVKDKVVQFDSQTYGGISPYSYSWDFGDQSEPSSAPNPSHTYTAVNTYNVTLNVTDSGANYSNVTTLIDVVILKANSSTNSSGYVQQNETVYFNDTSEGYYNITSWYWDFDDGYNSTEQNTSHQFTTDREYNVTLTVTDNQSNNNTFYQIICVDSVSPEITYLYNLSDIVGFGYPVIFTVNVTDGPIGNETGINSAKINISYPDQSYGNFTMDLDTDQTYLYLFNDTFQIGQYNYTIWTVDNSGNGKISSGRFNVSYCFGHSAPGNVSQDVKDRISGSVFNPIQGGVANNITAHIKANGSSSSIKSKCMIYRTNDSALIGTTQEIVIDTDVQSEWIVYNFSDPKPVFSKDTGYVLMCWSNNSCNLSYDQSLTAFRSLYDNESYGNGTPPNPASWNNSGSILDFERRSYSIYCNYTPDNSTPEITSVSNTPDTVGFGFNVTIQANVTDNQTSNDTGVKSVTVEITFPVSCFGNYTMENIGGNTYEFVFNNTWQSGQYNYTIWAMDKAGNINSSTGHSFNVSGQATISVSTIKDSYGDNESVNLTDPPSGSPLIGYELLDDGDVLHIWNKYGSYYFDTDSGIQLTNHYNEYWSHNVLMLGYYNNDQWNLMYRTDELSDFNKDIDTDNETYINFTIWENLEYYGYDFRLAIRYYLGVDDNELTVIPYIKNIDQNDIPYILGFGWEMKDIQIDMTTAGDYIEVNRTMYYLNQTLNNTYTDLSESEFYLMENITATSTKSLYLRWNDSLTYKLQVKSREGQYNAPVTLFVRIGTLASGQEKHTKMYWYDADQVTYYFNSYDNGEAWATSPSYMVDGSMSNHASTTIDGDIELCDSNNCSGSDIGEISKVEIRICAHYTGGQRNILLRPVFGGSTDGVDIRYTPPGTGGVWSPWFDITNDPFAPSSWTWTDVDNLDCDVEVETDPMGPPFTMHCSKVEIRVTYTPYNPPEISNPYPANGGIGVAVTPTMNITVSDANSDLMNITWLSNSSGSWQVFGTNNSVGNGTYHQTFSNATENGKWWYWKVNVSDGYNYTVSSVYKFYTGYQSKINNTGSTNISGYLLIQVHYYNETSENWTVADDTVNETILRIINSSEQFGLDTLFNGLVNTSDLQGYGNGTYRIYAALRDPDGNVLICDDETELEATYEFTITFE